MGEFYCDIDRDVKMFSNSEEDLPTALQIILTSINFTLKNKHNIQYLLNDLYFYDFVGLEPFTLALSGILDKGTILEDRLRFFLKYYKDYMRLGGKSLFNICVYDMVFTGGFISLDIIDDAHKEDMLSINAQFLVTGVFSLV